MARVNSTLQAFNRGRISPLALGRTDLKRTAFSADEQTNWIPRVLGSMMLRPGTQYIATTKSSLTAVHIPFIFASDDTAYLQLTDSAMRIFVSDTAITRAAVTTPILNGLFTYDLSNWTDDDDTGATSQWGAGGYMQLQGTGFASARRYQEVITVETGTAHALRIIVQRGPVELKIGSTVGASDYAIETLGTGTHSLSFTPTGNFFIEFSNLQSYSSLVDSVAIEASGTMELPTPWLAADLRSIRWDQSADVIYVACDGYQQRKIERRGTTSWSIVLYEPKDGPFRVINTTGVGIAPSATSGDITLTATDPFFKSTNVGSLFKIESIGQTVTLTATGADQWTDPIRVTGVDNSRVFDIDITGTWSATVTVQRSVGEIGDWADVAGLSFTTNQNTTHDDALDNQIIYYRMGIKAAGYASGTADLTLAFGSGSNTGVVRVTEFLNETTVSAVVLDNLGGTTASTNWYEGDWSPRRGYPSAVALYEGRAAWAGKSKIWLSISDAYESFDDGFLGDAGPINKSIGTGPIDRINWIFPGNRLVLGTDSAEASIRSSSFDEPLSPTAFSIRFPSTLGSTNVPIVKVDNTGIFVQRGGAKVSRLVYNDTSYEYGSASMTTLVPEIGEPSIIRLAVQRLPDTRVHCVRSDGTVAIMIDDAAEDVSAWVEVEMGGTDAVVEDVFVMPGDLEDRVYYLVARTINGSTVRYLEKWALESECAGGTLNKQLDSFILYSGASTTAMTGLSHLEGATVKVWGNGLYNGSYTVSGGAITLSTAVTSAVIGLTYRARFKSTKLAYGGEDGNTALVQRKRLVALGLLLHNVHKLGLQVGTDFDNLDYIPVIGANGAEIAADTVTENFDVELFSVNDTYGIDNRLCMEANAPYPVTVLAAILGVKTDEKL